MAVKGDSGMLLGEKVAAPTAYAPEVLYPIERAVGRGNLAQAALAVMQGVDVWQAYELSWLDDSGRPFVGLGRFQVPAASAHIIESKSLKLYLNSLNSEQIGGVGEAIDRIAKDLTAVAGVPVEVAVFPIDAPGLFPSAVADYCIDESPLGEIPAEPLQSNLKTAGEDRVEEVLVSHLLRSLCPVTGQPDWASVRIDYAGQALDHGALLGYLLGYREHQEFHEQCVERIFCDLYTACAPERLTVQAFYTRRGGLDINPLRSTEEGAIPGPRHIRQ